jgi:hypothetical protein
MLGEQYAELKGKLQFRVLDVEGPVIETSLYYQLEP